MTSLNLLALSLKKKWHPVDTAVTGGAVICQGQLMWLKKGFYELVESERSKGRGK